MRDATRDDRLQARRFRPGIEGLEGRVVLAYLSPIGGGLATAAVAGSSARQFPGAIPSARGSTAAPESNTRDDSGSGSSGVANIGWSQEGVPNLAVGRLTASIHVESHSFTPSSGGDEIGIPASSAAGTSASLSPADMGSMISMIVSPDPGESYGQGVYVDLRANFVNQLPEGRASVQYAVGYETGSRSYDLLSGAGGGDRYSPTRILARIGDRIAVSTLLAATADSLGGESIYGKFSLTLHFEVIPTTSTPDADLPDLRMIFAEAQQDAVAYGYEVSGGPMGAVMGLYQSLDAQFDASDRLVDRHSLPAGYDFISAGRFMSPSLQPGYPYLLVVADPDQSIPESSEANNILAILAPVNPPLGAAPVAVEYVGQLGGPANTFTILPDPTPNGPGSGYVAPHWFDQGADGKIDGAIGDRRFPVGYVRSTVAAASFPRVRAVFAPTRTPQAAPLIRGDGPGGFDFPARPAVVSAGGIQYEGQATGGFGTTVEKIDDFRINWEMSTDGGSTWISIGSTSNPVYVTLAMPATKSTYLTVVNLAVANGAGRGDDMSVIDAIWAVFADLDVRRFDGAKLTYYASWQTEVTTIEGLLASGDSGCEAWAVLFGESLRVQGLTTTQARPVRVVQVVPAKGFAKGFLVNRWGFKRNGTGGNQFSNVNMLNGGIFAVFDKNIVRSGGNRYSWEGNSPEFYPIGTHRGQGGTTPFDIFRFHIIVQVGTRYYDPSYGKTYKSLRDMDRAVIAGYWKYSGLIRPSSVAMKNPKATNLAVGPKTRSL